MALCEPGTPWCMIHGVFRRPCVRCAIERGGGEYRWRASVIFSSR